MKKFYVTIIVLLISNCLSAQLNLCTDYLKHRLYLNHQKNLAEEEIIFKMNSEIWVPTNWLSQMWEDNDWLNMAYTEFFYDSNGKLTSDLNKGWSDNIWVNNTRTTYTYENNLQTLMVSENWVNDAWVPSMKSQWTYNENNRVTNILDQYWENNEWVNSSQTTYTYSGNNCTELIMQDWVNGAWELTHKTTYEYDGEGNNISSISESWIMGILITSREINTFEQGLRITSLGQTLAGTEWIDNSRATYSYNENGQQTQFVGEQWTGAEWIYTMNGFYTYDINGNNTEILTQTWQNDSWVNFMKETIDYQQATDVEENEISISDFKLFNNYPNPFNPSTKIGFRIANFGFVSLKVFDVLGNEISTLVNEEKTAGNYEVNFNAAGFPTGLYLYKLQTVNYSETKKMMLLK